MNRVTPGVKSKKNVCNCGPLLALFNRVEWKSRAHKATQIDWINFHDDYVCWFGIIVNLIAWCWPFFFFFKNQISSEFTFHTSGAYTSLVLSMPFSHKWSFLDISQFWTFLSHSFFKYIIWIWWWPIDTVYILKGHWMIDSVHVIFHFAL